jgi:hypothetical protein
VHTPGYRGHRQTKSGGWSTALGQLQTNHHSYELAHHTDTSHIQMDEWTHDGNGYATDGALARAVRVAPRVLIRGCSLI